MLLLQGHGLFSSKAGSLPWMLLAACYAVLGAYRDFGGHSLLFRGRMEFLPLLLTSDFCAILVLGAFGKVFSLLPSESKVE